MSYGGLRSLVAMHYHFQHLKFGGSAAIDFHRAILCHRSSKE